jgi:hypothetical protein
MIHVGVVHHGSSAVKLISGVIISAVVCPLRVATQKYHNGMAEWITDHEQTAWSSKLPRIWLEIPESAVGLTPGEAASKWTKMHTVYLRLPKNLMSSLIHKNFKIHPYFSKSPLPERRQGTV